MTFNCSKIIQITLICQSHGHMLVLPSTEPLNLFVTFGHSVVKKFRMCCPNWRRTLRDNEDKEVIMYDRCLTNIWWHWGCNTSCVWSRTKQDKATITKYEKLRFEITWHVRIMLNQHKRVSVYYIVLSFYILWQQMGRSQVVSTSALQFVSHGSLRSDKLGAIITASGKPKKFLYILADW